MNNILIAFWYAYFYLFKTHTFKRQARHRYRVVQTAECSFEIQCYQDVSITYDTGPNYQWIPYNTYVCIASKENYIQRCKDLRYSYYDSLKKKYLQDKTLKHKLAKYPKVIY